MSLKWTIFVWTFLAFVVLIVVFGAIQISIGRHSTLVAIDRELRDRVEGAINNMGQPRFQRPDFPPGQQPAFRKFDFRRPRIIPVRRPPDSELFPDEPLNKPLFDLAVQNGSSYGFARFNDLELRIFSVKKVLRDGSQVVGQVGQDMVAVTIARQAMLWALLAAFPVAALLALVVTQMLAGFVVKPVIQLAEAAEEIAQNPDKRLAAGIDRKDEVGRLSESFNVMTHRLQESNSQLAQSLESQRRFTGDAAHELRTPLTSIALAVDNALHEDARSEDIENSLQTIKRSSNSMQKLIHVLLSLSKLDSAHSQISVEPVDLGNVVDAALQLTNLEQDDRIRINGVNEHPIVRANFDAMVQIVSNLLENAAYYTPEDGEIRVNFKDNRLEISDTGPGIAPEHLSRIFDRFYRVDPSRSRKSGGHGLGLSICQSLALAQGLNLKCESQIGQGTIFVIEFGTPLLSS